METLRDSETFQRCVGRMRRGSPDFTTNLYASRHQIERWCASGKLRAISAGSVVLLLRADRDLHHVYHVAEDRQALTAALRRLEPANYTTDLVGEGHQLDEICDAHADGGFAPHTFLIRMARTRRRSPAPRDGVDIATAADAPDVASLLDRLLDRFAEQVPEVDEVRREAEGGRLLVVRRGGAVAGMLMYETKGHTAHLRLWHVDPDARDDGVGGRLMARFLERCADAQRILLWVIGNNERSVAIYRHYGFEPDGLIDRIMSRQELQR